MSFGHVFALMAFFAVASAQAATATGVTPGDAAAGETKAAVCAACHGADGNSAISMYPNLAGQNESYIALQLAHFKSGQRDNAIMAPFASMLSDQDMQDVGAFFATKHTLPGKADEAFVERGQALYRGGDAVAAIPACIACHGPDGRGMAGAAYPQVAGQYSEYLSAKLTEWREGASWGEDDHSKIMPDIAKRLSDADIAALASYMQGLHAATPAATR